MKHNKERFIERVWSIVWFDWYRTDWELAPQAISVDDIDKAVELYDKQESLASKWIVLNYRDIK